MQSPINSPSETDPRLLDALDSLNQISAAINRMGSGECVSVEATLRQIVESAITVVPGASAVIYTYDPAQGAFDSASRLSSGEWTAPVPGDEPRPNGMGMRAIGQRRRVLSYAERDLEIHPIKVHAGAKSVACFPLVVADQAVGALYVYLHQDRPFSELELLMLENFVNQAAMAIYQTRRLASVQRDLARTEDELNRLRRAGLLISSRLRLEETLEAILRMALEVTNAHYGIFRLVDKSGEKLVTRAVAGERLTRPLVEALPIHATSVMGWVAQHRQPALISDLRDEPWRHIYYPLDAGLEMRSELAVPLIGAGGRLEGVLNLESPTPGAFSEQDSHLLQALATQAVIAIQEARLLDAVQEVAQLLLTQPCHQVLSRLVELACDLLNAADSAIWTLEGDQLILRVASAGYQRGERLPLHGSLTGQAILRRRPVTTDDARADAQHPEDMRLDERACPLRGVSYELDLSHPQDWPPALIAPMLTRDDGVVPGWPAQAIPNAEPIGALSVYGISSEPGRLAESEWDKKVLTCLAHYAALAVRNAARQEALRAAQEQHAVAETFAAVGDIAANLLHHLNNKVGAIPVRVQGIQDKRRSVLSADPYLAANLAEIERSAVEAMEAVRENLLHLHPIQLGPVSVADCARAAIAAASLPAGVRIQVESLDNLPVVVAGQRSLTLVFTNLLENAAEAMRGEGAVTIRGATCNGCVEIAVSDTGPGIAPELHDRIFEPNLGASARVGKLGFGLWWVKTLMTRLGGSVTVESDGRHGSTFRLRLPCSVAE